MIKVLWCLEKYLNLIGVQIPMKIQVDVWNYCDPITRKGRHVLKKRRLSRYTLLWLWSLFLVHQKKTLWFNFKNYFDFVFCKTIKPLCFSCTYSWLILVRNSLTDQISFMVRTNYKTRKNVYILLKFLAWKVLPVHFRDTHVLVYSV